MPTFPLGAASAHTEESGDKKGSNEEEHASNDPSSSPFTPITLALQGTLQHSHLHIWSEMNVLVHQSSSASASASASAKRNKHAPGQVVAGTAYSVPMITATDSKEGGNADTVNIPWDPWAAGQGTKVIRGEPLTFTFRVGWIPDGDVLGLVKGARKLSKMSGGGGSGGGFLFFIAIVTAGAVGGALALWWDRTKGRRSPRWRGEGLLGHSAPVSRSFFGSSNGSTVSFGDKGRKNGYGGYAGNTNGNSGVGYGYGGFSSGKKD